jgi:hypothetical protein
MRVDSDSVFPAGQFCSILMLEMKINLCFVFTEPSKMVLLLLENYPRSNNQQWGLFVFDSIDQPETRLHPELMVWRVSSEDKFIICQEKYVHETSNCCSKTFCLEFAFLKPESSEQLMKKICPFCNMAEPTKITCFQLKCN